MSNLVFMIGACIIAKCINPTMFNTDDFCVACVVGFLVDLNSFLIWRK
jgi:hypothetical protein